MEICCPQGLNLPLPCTKALKLTHPESSLTKQPLQQELAPKYLCNVCYSYEHEREADREVIYDFTMMFSLQFEYTCNPFFSIKRQLLLELKHSFQLITYSVNSI